MKAPRLCLLASALFLFAAGGLSASEAAPPPKPNFLVVMADDATFNELPLYGGRNLRTPSLDRLAEQGDPGAELDTTQAQQKHRAALKAAANPPQ